MLYLYLLLFIGHVHSVVGSSKFSQSSSYEDLLTSRCTTCNVAKDLSNKEKIVGKMVLMITGTYMIVYLPVIILVAVDPNATIRYPWLLLLVHLLLNSLVVIDPMIYMLSRKKYREEVKRMFRISNK